MIPIWAKERQRYILTIYNADNTECHKPHVVFFIKFTEAGPEHTLKIETNKKYQDVLNCTIDTVPCAPSEYTWVQGLLKASNQALSRHTKHLLKEFQLFKIEEGYYYELTKESKAAINALVKLPDYYNAFFKCDSALVRTTEDMADTNDLGFS